jgi:hypothetical protein
MKFIQKSSHKEHGGDEKYNYYSVTAKYLQKDISQRRGGAKFLSEIFSFYNIY